MKICIAASDGGHLNEVFYLKSAFEKHDYFVISYLNPRVAALPHRKYMLRPFTSNLFNIPGALWIVFRAFLRERPRVVISTGSEIAIPVFLVAKLFRTRTVFIETIASYENVSLTGRLLYPLSDRFFVQNEESLANLGPKAEFHGGIL